MEDKRFSQATTFTTLPSSGEAAEHSEKFELFFLLKDSSKKKSKQKRHLKLQQYPLVLQTPSDSQFERHGRQVTKQIKK